MVGVPITRTGASSQAGPGPQNSAALEISSAAHQDWAQHDRVNHDRANMVAAGTVLTAGLLLMTGRRKAGMTVAVVGTVLALLEEPETVQRLWKGLPEYLGQAQGFLTKVEGYVEQVSHQGQRLQGLLRR